MDTEPVSRPAAAPVAGPPPAPTPEPPHRASPWWQRALRSDWLVAAFALVFFLRLPDVLLYEHGVARVKTLLVVAGLALVTARWALLGLRPRLPAAPFAAAAALALAVLLSGLEVVDRAAWRHELGWIAKGLPISLLALALIDRPSAVRRVLAALVVAGALSGALTAHQHLTGSFERSYLGLVGWSEQDIDGEHHGLRATGSIGDANYYAQWLMVPLFLALGRLLLSPSRRELAAAAVAVLAIDLGLVFSYSRGGWLAAAATSTLLVLLLRRQSRAGRWASAAAVAALAVALAGSGFWLRVRTLGRLAPERAPTEAAAAPAQPMQPPAPPRRTLPTPVPGPDTPALAAKVPESVIEDHGLRGRASEAIAALQMFREHPLLGVGTGQSKPLYREYASRWGIDPRAERSAHSLYLEVAAELGLVGLVAAGAVLWVLFGGLLRTRGELLRAHAADDAAWITGFVLGLVGWLTAALFLDLSYPHLLLLLLGIGFAIPAAYGAGASRGTVRRGAAT